MALYRVFYWRYHRAGSAREDTEGNLIPDQRRDVVEFASDHEPTPDDVARASGDEVLRVDHIEQLEE